ATLQIPRPGARLGATRRVLAARARNTSTATADLRKGGISGDRSNRSRTQIKTANLLKAIDRGSTARHPNGHQSWTRGRAAARPSSKYWGAAHLTGLARAAERRQPAASARRQAPRAAQSVKVAQSVRVAEPVRVARSVAAQVQQADA